MAVGIMVPIGLQTPIGEWSFVGIPIAAGLFLWMLFGFSPLYVKNFKNDEFWISGFSREFLSRFTEPEEV
jgi:hypothetical protein